MPAGKRSKGGSRRPRSSVPSFGPLTQFRKVICTCTNPALLSGCPVPQLPLRKGQHNQLAFSLSSATRPVAISSDLSVTC